MPAVGRASWLNVEVTFVGGDKQPVLRFLDRAEMPRSVSYVTVGTVEGLCAALSRGSLAGAGALAAGAAAGMALGTWALLAEGKADVLTALQAVRVRLERAAGAHSARVATKALYEQLCDALGSGDMANYRKAHLAVARGAAALVARLRIQEAAVSKQCATALRGWYEDACKGVRGGAGVLPSAPAPPGTLTSPEPLNATNALPAITLILHGDCGVAGGLECGSAVEALAGLCAWTETEGRPPLEVVVPEQRPSQLGSRLLAPQLRRAGVKARLCADSAAAGFLQRGAALLLLEARTVGPQGDVLAEPGAFSLALAARAHGTPVWVCANLAFIDWGLEYDKWLRGGVPALVRQGSGALARADAPPPDIIPYHLVDLLITQQKVFQQPLAIALAKFRKTNPFEL